MKCPNPRFIGYFGDDEEHLECGCLPVCKGEVE